MNFPGNTPYELAPYIAPGNTTIASTSDLLSFMRRRLTEPSAHAELVPPWSTLVRAYLKAHARQQRRYGYTTHTIAAAIARQPSDNTVLRYFLYLAQEFTI